MNQRGGRIISRGTGSRKWFDQALTVAKHRRLEVIIPRVWYVYIPFYAGRVSPSLTRVLYIYIHAHIHRYICSRSEGRRRDKTRIDETFVVLSSSSGKWDIPLVGTEWEKDENRDNRLGYYFSQCWWYNGASIVSVEEEEAQFVSEINKRRGETNKLNHLHTRAYSYGLRRAGVNIPIRMACKCCGVIFQFYRKRVATRGVLVSRCCGREDIYET